MWEISAKILNSKAVGVKQSFLFLEQNTWFLALFKVFYGILHYVIYQIIIKSDHEKPILY